MDIRLDPKKFSELDIIDTLDGEEIIPIVKAGQNKAVKTKNITQSSTPDATTTVKGKVQLTGDLGGTSDSPTVPGLSTKTPATRQITGNNGIAGGGDLSADRTIGLAQIPSTTLMGNNSGITAIPSNLTIAQVKAMLAIAQGDVGNLISDLAAKAGLASPVFTGIPAVPTAAADTNTAQAASAAFVQGEISRAKLPNLYIAPHGYSGKADYVCSGANNNDVEINLAHIAASALPNGGNVVLLPGVYTITNHILRLPNVHLFGHGVGVTKIQCVTGFTQNMIDMDKATYNQSNPMVNSWVYDVELDASNMARSSASKCINGGNFSRCKLFRVFAHDSTATGIGDDDFYGTTIDQCIVMNCGYSNKHIITAASWAANAFTFTTADVNNYIAWTQATGVLTAIGTISDGDTAAIDGLVYTFKTVLTGAPYEVFINGSVANALTNLKSAVNATGTPGTDYGTGTVKLGSTTATTLTSTTLTFASANYGITGNSITTTATGSNIHFGAATLTGGIAGSKIVVAGMLSPLYNGTFNVVSIIDNKNFTVSGANNSTLLNFGTDPGTPTQFGTTSDALIGHNGIGIASGSLANEACIVTNSICIGNQNNNFLIEADYTGTTTNSSYIFANCISIFAGSCGYRNTGSLNAQFNGCFDYGSPIGGFAAPVSVVRTITSTSWSGGVATITTSAAHGFSIGSVVTQTGMIPTVYNNDFIVQSVPSSQTYTIALASDPGTALLLGTATWVAHPIDGTSFNNLISVANLNYGVDVEGDGVLVTSPVIYGGYNFGARLLNASYSQINDCRIYGNGRQGVLLETSSGVTTPMTQIKVTGFVYNNGTRFTMKDGIDFSPSTTAPIQNVTLDVHAFDDQPTQTQRYGVILRSGGTLTNILIRGNLSGNLTAPTLVQNTSSSIYFDGVVGVNPNGSVNMGNIGGSTTFDVSKNNLFVGVLTSNMTAVMPSPAIGGAKMTWILQQDSTGTRTLSLPANANAQTTLTLSTSPNVVDIISWTYDNVAGKWRLSGKLLGNTGVGTLSSLVITTPNGNNTVTLNLTQNDTTNNPDGADFTNLGTGNGVKISQTGVLAASKYGLFVDSSTAQVNAPLARFRQNSASSTADTVQFDNLGTGNAIFVNTGSVKLSGGVNISFGVTIGTMLGTAKTQKLGFWGATPIVQPSGDILTALQNIGLVSSPTISESDVTNLTTDLAANAPTASPTFTGHVTVPTPTNGTDAATKTYVDSAITSSGAFLPADIGLLASNLDPALSTTTSTPLANGGTLYVLKMRTDIAISVTNIVTTVVTAGATLTSGQNFAALYNANKGLVGVTADQSTAWQSTGLKTMALASGPFSIAAGYFYVVLWSNGTTKPAFIRGNSSSVTNGALTTANSRFATADTSITTTAPSTLGTFSALTTAYWAGVN